MLRLHESSPLESARPAAKMPCTYQVRQARDGGEVRQAYALRRDVFCREQGIFAQDDRDAIDAQAQLLVALVCEAGEPEQVVGTVRIHEAEPGIWWGSRLAVHTAFRRQGHWGAALIRLAVSRAHAEGCQQFLAHVQQHNAAMFEKLHWQAQRAVWIYGRPHVLMQADLAHYPPSHDSIGGVMPHNGGLQ